MNGFEEILRQKGFPRVGDVVRSRKHNSLWRVMDREVWRRVEEDPLTRETRVVPTFYVSFWRIKPGVAPGVGHMLGHVYTLNDDSFSSTWEVVSFH
ncbi:MAG: hypothetical protein WC443_12475 [Desulfobaccales bacterium]